MKAARYYGSKDLRIEEVPTPEAGPGQVKIRIAWGGICGSDLHAYLDPLPIMPTATEPNPITGETLPITMGHEFSGTIVALGSGVNPDEWRVGQNVVVEPLISCWKKSCDACMEGTRNLCHHGNFIGLAGGGGGLSEYVATDVRYVHKLPDGVPLDIGACIEPLSVAWYAVKRSGYVKGQSALIMGAGPIGLFILKVLRAIDPTATVLVAETASLRRELAAKHGATKTLNPIGTDPDIPGIVRRNTGGRGVDVAFDAAGVQAALEVALKSLRPRGMFMSVALWETVPQINMNWFLFKEITMTGIMAYDRVHPEVIEAVAAGKFSGLEELITSKIDLEDVVEKGFMVLMHEKDKQVKILVRPPHDPSLKL